jgi:hypothetical protein
MARFRRMTGGGSLVVMALVAAGGGHAQAPAPPLVPPPITPAVPPPGATLSSPIEISYCLCLERDIATRQAELTVRRNAYETLAREIAEAEAAIARDRPRVNVNDPTAIDAFKRRLDQLDAMKARQLQVTLPDYQTAVAGYNERVAQYTQRCSGRVLDPRVTEQVRANLICRMDQ